MNFLSQQVGPFPLYVWLIVVVGGVVLYFVIRHFTGAGTTPQTTAATTGTTTAVNPLNPSNDPSIDSNTGVPYVIEEMIDPNTGVPFYYEYGPGSSRQGGSSGGSSGGSPQPPSFGGSNGGSLGNPPTFPPPSSPPAQSTTQSATVPANAPALASQTQAAPTAQTSPMKTTQSRHAGKRQAQAAQDKALTAEMHGAREGQTAPLTPATYTLANSYAIATIPAWPASSSNDLHAMWVQNGRGIPWTQWNAEVQRMNPDLDSSGKVAPNQRVKVPA